MAIMKFKNSKGEWVGIPAFKGENGKDGAIQYKAGKGINISEDNVISSDITVDTNPVAGSDNPVSSGGVYTALENKADKKYVDDNKYSLPIASSNTLGGIKIGDNLNIDENGVVSASGGNKTLLLRSDMTKEEKIIIFQEFYNDFLNNIVDEIIYMQYSSIGKSYERYMLSNFLTTPYKKYITFSFTGIYDAERLGSGDACSFKCFYNSETNIITGFNFEHYSYNNLTAYNRSVTTTRNNQALGVNNTMEFIPTGDYNPSTKKYVDDSINKTNENINNLMLPILPQNLVDNGFDYNTHQIIEIPVNHTIENISMAYEFELNENGYYESNNKGIGNSYSLCKVTFNNEKRLLIPISYINSGENNYDYGIFSNIDQTLSSSNSDDGATGSTLVFKNCKGESSTDVKEITYEIPAGEHFIYIKYRKDGSGDNANDSLQFKIPSTIPQEVYENRKMATTKYVDDAKIKGYYYMELSLGMLGVGDEDYVNNELPVEKHQPFKEIIDTINNDNVKQPKLIIANTDDSVVTNDGTVINNPLPRYIEISEINKSTTIEEGKTHYTLQGVCNPIRSNTDTSGNYVDMIAQIFIGGVESDNGYTVEHVFINLKMCMLPTKKYIDDAVSGSSGGITSESDPVFSASEAAKITSTDTANWNNKVDATEVNNILNSKSYLTSESDPTVPAWAKQPNKPTYTASEVGALPASTVIPTVPTKLSGFQDDLGANPVHTHSQYLTAHQDISGKQNKVLYGTADPTSDIGVEGDIYIKYV